MMGRLPHRLPIDFQSHVPLTLLYKLAILLPVSPNCLQLVLGFLILVPLITSWAINPCFHSDMSFIVSLASQFLNYLVKVIEVGSLQS